MDYLIPDTFEHRKTCILSCFSVGEFGKSLSKGIKRGNS